MRLNIDVANLRFFYVTTKFLEEKIPTIIPMIGIFYFFVLPTVCSKTLHMVWQECLCVGCH